MTLWKFQLALFKLWLLVHLYREIMMRSNVTRTFLHIEFANVLSLTVWHLKSTIAMWRDCVNLWSCPVYWYIVRMCQLHTVYRKPPGCDPFRDRFSINGLNCYTYATCCIQRLEDYIRIFDSISLLRVIVTADIRIGIILRNTVSVLKVTTY